MGTLSVTLSPWQEQLHCCLAPPTAVLNSAAFNSATITINVNVNINNLMLMLTSTMARTMIHPSMPPPPPPVVVSPNLSPPPASSAAVYATTCPRSVTMAAAGAILHHLHTRLVTHLTSTRLAQGRTSSDAVNGPPAPYPPVRPPGRVTCADCIATAITPTCMWARQPPPAHTMP
jgi:hypothetical protein